MTRRDDQLAKSNAHITSRNWSADYRNRLIITDVLVVVWSVFGSQVAWLSSTESDVAISGRLANVPLSYTAVSVGLCLAWLVALSLAGSRDPRLVGIGTIEYRRVANSSFMLFGLLAIACYLLKADLARGYFVTALPVGVVAVLLSRWIWRQWLVWKRSSGAMTSRVVLMGSSESVVHIGRELQRTPAAGYFVTGAVIKGGAKGSRIEGSEIPVLGDVGDILIALEEADADTVVVTSSADLSAAGLQRLSWALEPGRQHLVVAPGLTDIAGPRIHTRPVAGLPLIHVETPRYEGARKSIKRIFDFSASTFLLVVLCVPLIILAILVRSSTAGPVLFRQTRVGLHGVPFQMLKFRSMVVDAEVQLNDLGSSTTEHVGNEVMFKMTDDPRVTPVGRYLRRYSLDELPQLINVLLGSMSLVGPRPPLLTEVARYEDHVNRRFLVTPGITGLWQVSGRSNLNWEDTVRLDLYYVENWSLTGDLVILWRTARAVFEKDGAY